MDFSLCTMTYSKSQLVSRNQVLFKASPLRLGNSNRSDSVTDVQSHLHGLIGTLPHRRRQVMAAIKPECLPEPSLERDLVGRRHLTLMAEHEVP